MVSTWQAVAGRVPRHLSRATPNARSVEVGRHARSDATRYLCVAAHVDEEFTDRALRLVLDERHRPLAPCYGVDVPTVTRHCLEARNRRLARSLFIVGAGAVSVWTVGLAPLFVDVLAIALGAVAFWIVRTRWGARFATGVLAVLTVIWLLLRPQLVLPRVGDELLGVDTSLFAAGGLLELLVVLLLPYVLVSAVVIETLWVRRVLVTRLKESFHPESAASQDRWIEERLDALLAEERHAEKDETYVPVTIYSGYSPFVGSGPRQRAWSFALDLGNPKQDVLDQDSAPTPPQQVDIGDFYDAVQRRVVDKLTSGGRGPLAAVRTEQCMFVDGTRITGDERFLPDAGQRAPDQPPRTRLTRDEAAGSRRDPEGPPRYYLAFHIGSWEQEVVRSAFLHMAASGRNLYVEMVTTVLPPVDSDYHVVDGMARKLRPATLARLVGQSALRAPVFVARAPFELVRMLTVPLRRSAVTRRVKESMDVGVGVDYGAEVSLRELAADSEYHNYFQYMDAEQHVKQLELHVLDAILGHLDGLGIETRPYEERRTMIINQGLMVSGKSSISGSTVVAGPGAKLTSLKPAMA